MYAPPCNIEIGLNCEMSPFYCTFTKDHTYHDTGFTSTPQHDELLYASIQDQNAQLSYLHGKTANVLIILKNNDKVNFINKQPMHD